MTSLGYPSNRGLPIDFLNRIYVILTTLSKFLLVLLEQYKSGLINL